MKIKKKTMRRDEWPGKDFKKVLIKKEMINGNNALIGLILWTEGVEKVSVSNKTLLIVDKDYTWLEIAIEGQSYWVTSMYDDNDEFIEAYFDLNSKNILNEENPYFYDMFTDIIISKDKTVHILDEDELESAYKEGMISEKEYIHVRKITKELYNYIVDNVDSLLEYLKQKHRDYKKQIIENVL